LQEFSYTIGQKVLKLSTSLVGHQLVIQCK